MQAAMTGHLVLSTLHAQTAAATIARLEDMGVEPSILATSVNCIVAQRLARRLCLLAASRTGQPKRILPSSRSTARPPISRSTAPGLHPVLEHRLLRPRGPVRGAPRDGTAAAAHSVRIRGRDPSCRGRRGDDNAPSRRHASRASPVSRRSTRSGGSAATGSTEHRLGDRPTRGRGSASGTASTPAEVSSRACSGRSPRPASPASRGSGRARSGRSR